MERFMDLINRLVLEHKSNLSQYDIDNFKSASSQVMHEGVVDALLPDASAYTQYLDKMLDYANQVTVAPETLDEFYSKIYKSVAIDEKHISIPVQPLEDIDKIRPEYLANVPNEFDNLVQKILKGTISESEIKRDYIAGEYFNKVRKQLVKTSIPFYDVKDLLDKSDPAIVKIDSLYIQNNIIPFLRSYKQNIKELTVIAQNTKGRINNTNASMRATMKAIATLEADGKLDVKTKRLLGYIKYNMYRQYLNLCAYIVTLIIRKMKYYVYNIMAYVNLYNTIYNYFPEGELILHEYVEGDDIKDIDDTTLLNSLLNNNLNVALPHIQSAINKKKMEIANVMAKRHNIRLNFMDMPDATTYPYDTYPYAAINRTIADIASNIHTFEINAKDPNMIVDDVLTKAHLDVPFVSQYEATLVALTSVDYYTTQGSLVDKDDESVIMAIYGDICRYPKNITIISNNVSKCYNYLMSISDEFEINTFGLDDATFNEYQSTLERVIKNYKEYALMIAKKLLNRLDSLIDLMSDDTPDEDPSDPTPEFSDFPSNYSIPSYLEAYDDIVTIEKEIFESMMRDYYTLRRKKDTGAKVVFEDVTQADDNATQASVKTDAQTQHSQNENKTATTNTQANSQVKESIIDKFKRWWKDLFSKYTGRSEKLVGTNNKWLASVKNDILNLDTSNTTINLARYENVTREKITADIQAAINKINGLNANNLPADLKSKDKAELFLFPSIPAKIGNETGFTSRIKQFFTFGNTDQTKLTSYSADDAKTKISSMIDFCEGYENMYKSISNDLDKLAKAAADKQQAIINALGTQAQTTTTTNAATVSATESVLFEAPQTQSVTQNGTQTGNTKDNKNKLSSSNMITSVVREYSGAIFTVIEKKYLDFIKVLAKLAPKKENTAPQQNAGNNEDQQQANGQ